MPKSQPISPNFSLLERLWREPVERTVLPNGLTVVLKPDHSSALASVQVWARTGSMHEGAFLGAGLSHFLEHMLFKGTGRRTGPEISAAVQAHGGYFNAYTTFDRTVYHIDLPSEHLEVAVDHLADGQLDQGTGLRELPFGYGHATMVPCRRRRRPAGGRHPGLAPLWSRVIACSRVIP